MFGYADIIDDFHRDVKIFSYKVNRHLRTIVYYLYKKQRIDSLSDYFG